MIGKPVSRVDGHAKVTGQAKYAADLNVPDLAYGVVVSSEIAKGRIKSIDRSAALAVPGVIKVFAHDNRPKVASSTKKYSDEAASPGSPFRPLHDDQILFAGQPVALVVAEEFEIARYAATLVAIEYEAAQAVTDIVAEIDKAYEPKVPRMAGMTPVSPRGEVNKALARSRTRVEQEYRTPMEHHNPMECFGSTAVWEGDGRLTIYDKTQGSQNTHSYVCNVFGLAKDKVRVLSPFVGGAFGSGLRPQYQLFLTAMAAIGLKRSVRVGLTRQQMILGFGHRPETIQTLSLGADEEGHLQALKHHAVANTSSFEDYQENVVNWGGVVYHCDNLEVGHKLVQIDFASPMDMRAPGAAVGVYALECAMDELSYALGIDPLELRLRNYAEIDGNEDKPFTSKALKDCYYQGAERFGWSKRQPPRSMRNGRELIGYGHGYWDLGSLARAHLRRGRAYTRREAHRQHRRCRYWHRYLHHSGSDRRRDAWLAARRSRDQDRRLELAAMPCRRRLMDGGVRGLGGYAGLRGRSPANPQTCATDQEFAAEGRGTRRHRIRRR